MYWEQINQSQHNIIDKKKEIMERKRYEQLHKNYNQQASKISTMPSV